MELLLLKYGYLLLFAGVLVEGEAFLIAGSFLANRGYFNISTVALVALAANTLSAQFYYTAARVRGRGWFEARFPETSAYRRIIDWVARHNNWLLLMSRFLFGFRIVIPAACGAFGMPAARFVVLNMIAGILWVIPTALAGFSYPDTVGWQRKTFVDSLHLLLPAAKELPESPRSHLPRFHLLRCPDCCRRGADLFWHARV